MTAEASGQSTQESKKWFWVAALGLLVVVIVGVVVVQMLKKPEPKKQPLRESDVVPVVQPEIETLEEVKEYTSGRPIPKPNSQVSIGRKVNPNEHIRGNPDALISIVQYVNIGNHYAKLIQPELKKLVEEDTQVNWVFRHFPDPDKKTSYPASYIAECVSKLKDNDTFWEYLDTVYKKNIIKQQKELIAEAIALDIDATELSACMSSELVEIHVKDNKHVGFVYGKVRFMPTFLFQNNETEEVRVMEGIDTMDFVKDIIRALKKGSEKNEVEDA